MAKPYNPNQVLENALTGSGPCSNCPAHRDTEYTNRERRSHEIHPGYLNPDADIMVVSEEPAHPIKWDKHSSWEDYNQVSGQSWKEARGHHITSLLPTEISLEDLWITDAVKCPPPYNIEKNSDGTYKRDYSTPLETSDTCSKNRETEKQQCRTYLKVELKQLEPDFIIGLGNNACNSLLKVLDHSLSKKIGAGRDGGRVIPSNPPIVVSPHWSHNWLNYNPQTRDYWGRGWIQDRAELQDPSLDQYSKVVRKSVESVRSGELP